MLAETKATDGLARTKKTKKLLWVCLLGTLTVLVAGLAALVASATCSFSQFSANDHEVLADFQSLSGKHQVIIADQHEEGDRLVLCLTFVDARTLDPLANEDILLYHTTSAGEYEPDDPNDDSTARLRGSGVTDSGGRILVRTVLPGDYGSSSDNRHIHMTVHAAQPSAYDIQFRQFSTFMLRRFVARSHQHFLADIKRSESGELVVFITIACKIPQ